MSNGSKEIFRAALKEARLSFEKATKRLSELELEAQSRRLEISQLRRTITALAAQCSEDPWSDGLGITEAVAEVMETAFYEMSTQDVVKCLENMGFDLTTQKNAAASVHAILSRLVTKGKVQRVTNLENSAVTWRGPRYDPKASEITDDDIPF